MCHNGERLVIQTSALGSFLFAGSTGLELLLRTTSSGHRLALLLAVSELVLLRVLGKRIRSLEEMLVDGWPNVSAGGTNAPSEQGGGVVFVHKSLLRLQFSTHLLKPNTKMIDSVGVMLESQKELAVLFLSEGGDVIKQFLVSGIDTTRQSQGLAFLLGKS